MKCKLIFFFISEIQTKISYSEVGSTIGINIVKYIIINTSGTLEAIIDTILSECVNTRFVVYY